MKENFARQRAAYLEKHGKPMPADMQAHAITTMLALQSLYFKEADSEARPEFACPTFWHTLAPGFSTDPEELRSTLAGLAADAAAAAAHPAMATSLLDEGFFIAETSVSARVRVAGLCAALAQIQVHLQAAGLPPNFVFVFNASWELLAEHWIGAASSALGEGCIMEADMNCWALRREGADGAATSLYVGANFSASHRDQCYSACHAADGALTSINLWTPYNPCGARADNGAMRVLCVDADDFFFCPEHPSHLNTSASMAAAGAAEAVRILECSAGAACLWSPSLIHWGGGCSIGAEGEPRSSLAVTFRAAGAPRSVFGLSDGGGANEEEAGPEGVLSSGGPPTMLLADLSSLPLQRRLSYVAKGLLSYSHWHPGFPGVELSKRGAHSDPLLRG